MAIGGDAQVPCKKGCVCGPFNNAGKLNFPLWWYGEQGIFYNFAGGHATPTKCPFTNYGLDFNGVDSFLTDEQSRKILRDGTDGIWSSINLDCTYPPSCGSITGVGAKLYLNDGNVLAPKISGSLVLYPKYCPNLTHLYCYNNSISVLNVAALTSLTHLYCYNNSISILDVAALTTLTHLSCGNNSISMLDVAALTSLTYLLCYSNSLAEAAVDKVLIDVEANSINNGTLNISNNVVPGAAGLAAKATLIAAPRNWAVTTD